VASKNNQKVTWAQAFRDVVIAAMNKGQLIPFGLLAVVIIIILRMPPAELTILTAETINRLLAMEGVAYIFLIATLASWFFHVKYLRRLFHVEMERVGQEKSALQAQSSKRKFKSSKSL
jgi:hypothetical protein